LAQPYHFSKSGSKHLAPPFSKVVWLHLFQRLFGSTFFKGGKG